MFLSDIVQIGEMLDVRVGDIITKTKLQDMLEHERFVVLAPTLRLVPVIVEENETVRFTFVRPNGVYSFQAVLEERFAKDNVKLCLFRAVTEVEKSQRRYGYRLPVVLNISLHRAETEIDEKPPDILAKTINLSERGALFSCFERFYKGTKLLLQMHLEKNDVLALYAEVVRCEPPIKRSEPYLIAVQFYDYSRKEQAHIGRYILKRQIIQRKLQESE